MKKCFLTVCLVFTGLASLAPDGRADEAAAAQMVVDNSNRTFTQFIDDPDMVWFRNNLGKARGRVDQERSAAPPEEIAVDPPP